MPNIPVTLANWKMNKTLAETEDYFHRILPRASRYRGNVEIVFLVPHTVLALSADLAKGSGVKVGSQDHFWKDFGSYTGEVSATMVGDCGGEYAMIGHYERRKYFNESNDDMHRKTKAALRNGLIPITCIGESREQRRSGGTLRTIKKQMDVIFRDFSAEEMLRSQILYEPLWAIGAEEPASPVQAQEAQRTIREEIGKGFGEEVAKGVKIHYGGSVRWENVTDFLIQADIDGVGIGRASWDPHSFLRILDAIAGHFPEEEDSQNGE